jgi:hypothetical protein
MTAAARRFCSQIWKGFGIERQKEKQREDSRSGQQMSGHKFLRTTKLYNQTAASAPL